MRKWFLDHVHDIIDTCITNFTWSIWFPFVLCVHWMDFNTVRMWHLLWKLRSNRDRPFSFGFIFLERRTLQYYRTVIFNLRSFVVFSSLFGRLLSNVDTGIGSIYFLVILLDFVLRNPRNSKIESFPLPGSININLRFIITSYAQLL